MKRGLEINPDVRMVAVHYLHEDSKVTLILELILLLPRR
jgi:hypothetical protein